MWASIFKVAAHGRTAVIDVVAKQIEVDVDVRTLLPSQSDSIISAFSRLFPLAHNRDDPSSLSPSSAIMNHLAEVMRRSG